MIFKESNTIILNVNINRKTVSQNYFNSSAHSGNFRLEWGVGGDRVKNSFLRSFSTFFTKNFEKSTYMMVVKFWPNEWRFRHLHPLLMKPMISLTNYFWWISLQKPFSLVQKKFDKISIFVRIFDIIAELRNTFLDKIKISSTKFSSFPWFALNFLLWA